MSFPLSSPRSSSVNHRPNLHTLITYNSTPPSYSSALRIASSLPTPSLHLPLRCPAPLTFPFTFPSDSPRSLLCLHSLSLSPLEPQFPTSVSSYLPFHLARPLASTFPCLVCKTK